MKLIIDKNRKVYSAGTWGTKNENNYEILDFEFPEELEEYNKRIVYYLGDERVWDAIVNNKAYITNAITTKGDVQAYVWCTKENTEREADTDFRTMLFEMHFYENENADGIVPTEQQVDGFNTMLTAMNAKIAEVNALEQTIGAAEAQRQDAEATRVSNENTRQSNESTRESNEQTRQSQEAERERRTDEAIGNIEDKTAEYNQNAEEKTEAFNTNASQKTNDFNSNYTQKVNEFNSNANSKTSDFNSNAETKTNAFNTNATNETNNFNNNATEKTTAFDNNATEKTSEFNTNAESKTSAFNDNATQKTTNFDNNATEKTNEFNTNAQEKIDEYDEHIVEYQAQIDELQEEVEELSENMPWNETEQATEISVDDAAKYSKNKLELFGNTEQASYEGRNVLKYDNTLPASITKKGLTVSIDKNGIVTVNGTSTGQEFFGLINGGRGLAGGVATDATENNMQLNSNSTYTLSFKKIEGTCPSGWHISSRMVDIGWKEPSVDGSTTFSGTSGVNQIYIGVSGNYTFDNFKFTLQLEEGSTATDYEPYVGGVPSPNPDYPQDIHVVSGENTIEVNSKNFYDATQGQQTKNSLTYSADNQYIYLDGKVSNGFNCDFKHFLIPKGTYTMIFELKDGNINTTNDGGLFYVYGSVRTSPQKITNTNKRRAVTFTLNTDDFVYVHVWPRSSETFSNARIAYQLVKENVADYNFVPYYHADYPINLGSLELCKIGDYQDYLYKENGNWYESKRINKYKLTSGFIDTGGIRNEVYRILTSQSSVVITPALNEKDTILTACTHFASITRNQSDSGNITTINSIAMLNTGGFMISLPKGSDLSSVNAFKTFVDNNDIIIYYILATPIITQITDTTLISQLDEIYEHLKLVKGTNNITVTAADLAPLMKLSYMQDLPSKLDNLDSRLALLE